MSAALALRRGVSELTLLPHLGGAIGGFIVGGRPVLRPTPQDATSPLDTACFPLVPYANRIAGGRFVFAGGEHSLPANFPGFENPLHGLGWLRPWNVAEHEEATATLTFTHRADVDWPWDWSAVQRFELTNDGLRITIELVNASPQAMPGGLGLHPYFVRDAGDELSFGAAGVWANDAAMIPVRTMSADAFGDFAQGSAPAPETLIDNCYFGWDGQGNWGAGSGKVTLRGEGADFLHIFAPPGEDFICIEPTTHMPDALNQADFLGVGGKILAPGDAMRMSLTIKVGQAD